MTMDTKEKIVDAAIYAFVRFGATKTSMADIGDAAGVSRQTLYDIFGNKDELIVASIQKVAAQNLAQARSRIRRCRTLHGQLTAYFEETIIKSFTLVRSSNDPEDLITGHNKAGRAAIEASHRDHEKLIKEVLAPYEGNIKSSGQSVTNLARLLVTTTMGFKGAAKNKQDLDNLLSALKALILAIATRP